MADLKKQLITNDTVGKEFFDIPNIKKEITTRQLNFINKVACNSGGHLPPKLITAWCNHNRQCTIVINTNKKSIFHNLCLVIPKEGKKWSAQNMGALCPQ